jgi:hypothetical protein
VVLLTGGAAAQRLAKQLGVPGGGKGSRKQIEERLANFNRYAGSWRRSRPAPVLTTLHGCSENERALQEDPERWPQQASNFNLVPVNIEVRWQQCKSVGAT